jgi:hypothetical protein
MPVRFQGSGRNQIVRGALIALPVSLVIWAAMILAATRIF